LAETCVAPRGPCKHEHITSSPCRTDHAKMLKKPHTSKNWPCKSEQIQPRPNRTGQNGAQRPQVSSVWTESRGARAKSYVLLSWSREFPVLQAICTVPKAMPRKQQINRSCKSKTMVISQPSTHKHLQQKCSPPCRFTGHTNNRQEFSSKPNNILAIIHVVSHTN
jgi:hypothetical protein